MAVIETEALTKTYSNWRGRSVQALDQLDLAVEEGGVHGFLGPNGSGKTTAIRCLLGLARPSGGTARILGRDVTEGLHPVIDRIGAIVEHPKFAPWMSGRRNLALAGAMAGISAQRVDEMLELVGLADRADDRYGAYSLGMRQRLAVAGALLRDPEVVILDEPANGLDPEGIRAIRDLLRRLGAEGRTVFVSSHQLAEIQQTCDSVTIIRHGRCVVTGSVADVLEGTGGMGGRRYLLEVADAARSAVILSSEGFTVENGPAGRLIVVDPPDGGSGIVRCLAAAAIYPESVARQEASLEDVYLELTAGDDPPAVAPSTVEGATGAPPEATPPDPPDGSEATR